MQRVLCLLSWFLALSGSGAFHQAVAAAERAAPLALSGASIFDGTGAPPMDGIILLHGERIAAIGPRAEITLPDDARVIDLSGYWIIPGLIAAHVHFFQSGSLYTRPDIIDLRRFWPYASEIAWIRRHLPANLARYLASGITSVVDMAGPWWVMDVRDAAEQTASAPRVALAGTGLAPGLPPGLDSEHAPGVIVRTPQQARAEVRRLAVRCPDFIKIWFAPTPAMDLEQEFAWINAAVEESHANGLRVCRPRLSARSGAAHGADRR